MNSNTSSEIQSPTKSSTNEWSIGTQGFNIFLLYIELSFTLIDFLFRLFMEKGLTFHVLRPTENRNLLLPSPRGRIKALKVLFRLTFFQICANLIGRLTVRYAPLLSVPFYAVMASKVYLELLSIRTDFPDFGRTEPLSLFAKKYFVESRFRFLSIVFLVVVVSAIYISVSIQWFLAFDQIGLGPIRLGPILVLIIVSALLFPPGYWYLWLPYKETQAHIPEAPPQQWLDRFNDVFRG